MSLPVVIIVHLSLQEIEYPDNVNKIFKNDDFLFLFINNQVQLLWNSFLPHVSATFGQQCRKAIPHHIRIRIISTVTRLWSTCFACL
jgi:hypothetical protein